jgi:hypothetical protein
LPAWQRRHGAAQEAEEIESGQRVALKVFRSFFNYVHDFT